MPGRVETYVHSDAVVQNKGGSLVEVTCQTDFAAKTPEFIAFCKKLAKAAYASVYADGEDWESRLASANPTLAQEQVELERALGEDIYISNLCVFVVDENPLEVNGKGPVEATPATEEDLT